MSHAWAHARTHARTHTGAHRLLHAHTWTAASRHSIICIEKAIVLATCNTSRLKVGFLVVNAVVPTSCGRLVIIVLVESNHSIAPISHYNVSLLVLGCRVVVDDSANAISGFIVILRVDLLHVLNILNELLIAALTRLESKVRKVGLDSLSISFDEAINLGEGEESVQCEASHVEQKRFLLLFDSNNLVENTDFHEALISQFIEVVISSHVASNFLNLDVDVEVNMLQL